MDKPHVEEPTFRRYTPAQAKAYAWSRGSYNPELIDVILNHHRSTGGSFDTLLDVGCGPGNSTRPLATHFDTAYGLDPSQEMVNAAKGIGMEAEESETASGGKINFVHGRSEELGWLRDAGRKVDLLTSAMAVHWFDLPQFWASAAEVLNDGGTVALWAKASYFCHPSTPNAARVQKRMFQFEREDLAPYELPGNRFCRDAYDNLPLPWTVQPPVQGFSPAGFTRFDWDRDGYLSESGHFFLGDDHVTMEQLQKHLGTSSMVTRWREAHPEQAGTDQDVASVFVRDLEDITGCKDLVGGGSCHLLLLKKDASKKSD